MGMRDEVNKIFVTQLGQAKAALVDMVKATPEISGMIAETKAQEIDKMIQAWWIPVVILLSGVFLWGRRS